MTTPAAIQELIQVGENETLEFKSSFNNELIETLVAFANTSGGKIIAGINPEGVIKGISLNPESIQTWVNEIKNKTSPSLIPDVDVLHLQNKTIVVFSIKEYPVKPVSTRANHAMCKNGNTLSKPLGKLLST